MKRPVYIVCCGTGGHLAPGIATAQRFLDRGVPVELIISEKEVDSRLLQSYPEIPYIRAKGSPFGWTPFRLARFLFNSVLGGLQSLRLLGTNQPSALIAFGGYLSFSFVMSAWFQRVPVILHEANRKVGKSIKTLAGMADRVYLPEGVVLPGVEPRRLRRIGMPLRKEVRHLKKSEIRGLLGVPAHAKVLTVVGGSQGALALNEWVERHRQALASEGIWINLVAGPGKKILPDLESFQSGNGEPVEVRTYAFHRSLHELFCASDLVISRAGAGTIAELVACLTPSILIPYPHAADRHQLANAQDLEVRGGCVVVPQEKLETLLDEVMDMMYNDWMLGRMRNNLRKLIHEDPAEVIVEYVTRTCVFSQQGEDRPQ